MKKFFPILLVAFVSLFIFSCKDDNTDHDTYSQMRDVSGTFNSGNNYGFTVPIGIESTDVVLVYRRDVENSNAWQLIPKTYFLSGGRELDYNALFSSQNVEIYIDPNFDLSTMSSAEASTYLNNQVFRIVLVPASAAKGTTTVDTSDYNAVVKYYNLDESKIKTVKVN
jgi:ABC-type glycerol-3-phosphate transport system substrate-binding protein